MSCRSWLSLLLGGVLVWMLGSQPAQALTPIRLFDLTYTSCPADLADGNVTSGGVSRDAHCFLIVGKAENKSGKMVVDADVFGRIFDANGDPIQQNRGRLGTIQEIPPGVHEFAIRVSVPATQPEPLSLSQFKASGFAGKVRPFYYEEEGQDLPF